MTVRPAIEINPAECPFARSLTPAYAVCIVEFSRYDRQMLIPGIGIEGQQRLSEAHVAIVGCGALGCVSADLLARAGVGHITLIDRDIVEWSNLQRQSLFAEADAQQGMPKALAAAARLKAINSQITVRGLVADLLPANSLHLLDVASTHPPNAIVDGSDNFATRFLLNDISISTGIPYLYAGVVGKHATVMPVVPGRGPCLRCLLPELPPPGSTPTCDTAGVLGPIVTIAAAVQTAQALELLLDRSAYVVPGLIELQLNPFHTRTYALSADVGCACCSKRDFSFLSADDAQADATLCGRDAVQIASSGCHSLDLPHITAGLQAHADVQIWPFMLRASFRSQMSELGLPIALTLFRDGRAIVQGTRRIDLARSIYSRFVGG